MKTSEFLAIVETAAAEGKSVRFTTNAGAQVPPGYHVTEVMNVHVDSVDCGGRPSSFSRTVVQLWNGLNVFSGSESDFLSAGKIKRIFDRVDAIQTLLRDEEIFFEWGDTSHPTATYAVRAFDAGSEAIDFHLFVPSTQCKPAAELGVDCCSTKDVVAELSSACCR
jgi:hypothetical protein